MVISNTSNCPDCGGILKHYDKVSRVVRTKGGCKQKVKIRRLRCVDCCRLHREIPGYLYPYKQYVRQIIEGVRDGSITSETIDYEDYPCEMTMSRWMHARNLHPPL